MEKSRKMAGAFLEVQPDSEKVRLFFHEPHPLMNRGIEFPFENVGHMFSLCRGRRGAIATSMRSYRSRHRELLLCSLALYSSLATEIPSKKTLLLSKIAERSPSWRAK